MKNRPFVERLGFALRGLASALERERSFRTQAAVAAAVLVALVVVRPAPLWWALVAVVVVLVLATELINTAIENLVDHLHPDLHPEIKIVKDCLAGAVLVASLGAIAVALALAWELIG
jgi:undecaprenol kinase